MTEATKKQIKKPEPLKGKMCNIELDPFKSNDYFIGNDIKSAVEWFREWYHDMVKNKGRYPMKVDFDAKLTEAFEEAMKDERKN